MFQIVTAYNQEFMSIALHDSTVSWLVKRSAAISNAKTITARPK